MAESGFDPNPAKYLVVYGDDPRFKAALWALDETDTNVGETNSVRSNTIMVRYLNVLSLIQERDIELQQLIDEIHRIYSSKRYKIGHLLINPIESSISRIRKK